MIERLLQEEYLKELSSLKAPRLEINDTDLPFSIELETKKELEPMDATPSLSSLSDGTLEILNYRDKYVKASVGCKFAKSYFFRHGLGRINVLIEYGKLVQKKDNPLIFLPDKGKIKKGDEEIEILHRENVSLVYDHKTNRYYRASAETFRRELQFLQEILSDPRLYEVERKFLTTYSEIREIASRKAPHSIETFSGIVHLCGKISANKYDLARYLMALNCLGVEFPDLLDEEFLHLLTELMGISKQGDTLSSELKALIDTGTPETTTFEATGAHPIPSSAIGLIETYKTFRERFERFFWKGYYNVSNRPLRSLGSIMESMEVPNDSREKLLFKKKILLEAIRNHPTYLSKSEFESRYLRSSKK